MMADALFVRGGSVAMGSDPAILDAIAERQCALACWERACDPLLAADLNGLDLTRLCDVRETIASYDGDPEIEPLLLDAGYPASIAVRLAKDIATLARLQAAIATRPLVTLRLERVDTDACRRFHADYVTMRLITTYIGPGTQWIESDRPADVHHLAPGSVAIFKGRLLMPEPSILHRSPPIVHTGEQRLLLVIDPAGELDQ